MRARVSVFFGIFCSAVLMAGTPAKSSDSDRAKSVIEASQPPASIGSKQGEDTDQPIPKTLNVDPEGRDQDSISGSNAVEQISLPPDADAGGAKREGDSAAAPGSQAGNDAAKGTVDLTESTCLILKAAAAANGLPLEFFARVIWEESRFKPHAIGPTTRTGHRAQGIAQFMPYTATARGLDDPFNPDLALPEAAEFLAELRSEFGNLGLAAAAYNAGPGRVHNFLDGQGGMPAQTRRYVRAITGRTVKEWAALGHQKRKNGVTKRVTCRRLAALVKEPPAVSIGAVEPRVREAAIEPGEPLGVRRRITRGGESPVTPQDSRVRKKSMSKSESAALLKRRSAALNSRGSSGVSANSTRLTAVSTGSSSKPAERVKSGKSRARLAPSSVSARSKGRLARRRVQTVARKRATKASDDRLNKIMQICQGCLPTGRSKSEESSAQLSPSVSARSKARPSRRRVRTVARDKAMNASNDNLKKVMQICRGC